MTAAQLGSPSHPSSEPPPSSEIRATPPPSVGEMADELLPVVGVVFQAGPPAYTIGAFAAAIALLACAPLMILAAVVLISFVVTVLVAGVVGVVVRLSRLLLRDELPQPASTSSSAASIRTSQPRFSRPDGSTLLNRTP
jgi:hypothetical protein